MSPDGSAVELITVLVAVVAGVVLAVTWDHGSGRRRGLRRGGTVVLCVLTAVLAGLVWVNRQVETYTSWGDLLGAAPADAGSTALPPSPPGGGRVESFPVGHPGLPVYAYLPAAYDRLPRQRFPVIEALHGYPGSPMSWLRRLRAAAYLDAEIAAGRMAPTVVLFPYLTPEQLVDTECTNLVHSVQAETMLTVDVPAAAESRLRIRTDRAGWGLVGFSAGGFCAGNLLLRHPTRYAAAASLSGYADPGIAVGDGSEHTTNNDAWRLRHLPIPAASLYLACSRADPGALRGTRALAALARPPLSVTTVYVDGGGHNAATWEAMEGPAFDWLSGRLGRPLPVPDAGPPVNAASRRSPG